MSKDYNENPLAAAETFRSNEAIKYRGVMYGSDCATVFYDGKYYFVNRSSEEVKEMNGDDLEDHVHMGNLHLLGKSEISDELLKEGPPFERLLTEMSKISALESCKNDFSIILDPKQQWGDSLRFRTALRIELILTNYPDDARTALSEQLSSFIPPEDYVLDLGKLREEIPDYPEVDHNLPLLSELLLVAQPKWEENAKKYPTARLKKEEIHREKIGSAQNTVLRCLDKLPSIEEVMNEVEDASDKKNDIQFCKKLEEAVVLHANVWSWFGHNVIRFPYVRKDDFIAERYDGLYSRLTDLKEKIKVLEASGWMLDEKKMGQFYRSISEYNY